MKRPLWPVVLAFPWRSLLYHTAVATSGCWKANAAVVSLWVQMLLRCGSSLWTLWHSSIPTIHCTVVQKWHRVVCFRFVFLYASRWPGRPLVCSKQYEPISCMNVKTKIFARICTTARFTHLWRDPQTRVTAADQQHVFVIALLEWTACSADWSYSHRQIIVYWHQTGTSYLFYTCLEGCCGPTNTV